MAQAGFKHLGLSDLPASASQSAWITGMSHHTWPDPATLLRTISKEMSESLLPSVCAQMFIIVVHYKQPRCLTTENCLNYCNPSILGAQSGRLLEPRSLRSAWATW